MEESPSDIYMKTQLMFACFLGVLPYKDNVARWKKIRAKIIYQILLIVKLSSHFGVTYHIFSEWGHLPNPVNNLIMFSANLNTFYLQICIYNRVKGFQDLFKRMDKYFFVPNPESEVEKRIFEEGMRKARFITWCFIISHIFTGGSIMFVPLITYIQDGSKNLPYVASFPFDTTDGPGYWVGYIAIATAMFSMSIHSTTTCDFAIAIIIKTTTQFEYLQYKLRNIKSEVENEFKKSQKMLQESPKEETRRDSLQGSVTDESASAFFDMTGGIEDQEKQINDMMLQKLRDCLVLHEALIDFVKELNVLLNRMMMMEVYVYSASLCTNTFLISQVPIGSIDFVRLIFYSLTVLLLLYPLAYYGNELTLQSGEVAAAAYECGWEEAPQAFKKSVRTMMMRAQKPLVLWAWKFCTVDLEMFNMIMKASYSYYQVLNTVYD